MSSTDTTIDLPRPVEGVWFRKHAGGFELGATTRSNAAFFLVPFMIIWSGFTVGITYVLLTSPGKFNPMMFLIGTLFNAFMVFFWYLTLLTICGKVVVSVDGDQGKFFTGVGPVGLTRKFKWSDIREVRESVETSPNQNRYKRIVLRGRTRISIGGIKKNRQEFMLDILRAMLRDRRGPVAPLRQ
jgi:hypothetical protein